MKSAARLALAMSLAFLSNPVAAAPAQTASAKLNAEAAAAAQTFLATLDPTQRSNVVYDFKDETQRKRWSNLPVSSVKRGGLRMGDLTEKQRDAAYAALKASLSPQGYTKVQQIVEADDTLGKGQGQRMFSKGEYYVSFVGEPSATKPWMLQFGGHHLGLNVTFMGEHATLAPSHTGAQPAFYQVEGREIRPLGREWDKAFGLLTSLDATQRKQAVLSFQTRDLILGPARDWKDVEPEGIKGSALNKKEREMLVELAAEWTGILKEEIAKEKLEQLRKNLDETWFAWSGSTNKDGAAYFRLQAPTVWIEYAPQRLGGDPTKHIHTIYRDPTNEYGKQWWPE
jgi:hypothetical protein